MKETYLEIDIDKIRNNIINIKMISLGSMYCAVVKANAYGLGAVEISKNIEDLVDYFAVAKLSEALALRKNSIKKPILILGYVDLEDISLCSKYDIDISIYDYDYARKINDMGYKINCHLALDTGHSRLGFRNFEIDRILLLKEFKNINIVSAFSHFSTSDEEDDSFTKEQYEKFNDILGDVNKEFALDFVHISNSAAVLNHKIFKNMIRVGISMYGLYPSLYVSEVSPVKLERAFNLYSKVSFVKNVKKGTSISYGRTYITKKDTKVATVCIGYADGYMRAFSNIGEVKINSKTCRVLGRVCMDQIMVDVTGIDVNIGDKVTIYEDIDKEAEKIGTISYELMTSIDMRVIRQYYRNNKLIKTEDYMGEIYEN